MVGPVALEEQRAAAKQRALRHLEVYIMRRSPDLRETARWAARRAFDQDARPAVRNDGLLASIRGWLEDRKGLAAWPWGQRAREARQQAAERAARARLLRENSHWRVALVDQQLRGGTRREKGAFHQDHLRGGYGARASRRAAGHVRRHKPRLDGHRPAIFAGHPAFEARRIERLMKAIMEPRS